MILTTMELGGMELVFETVNKNAVGTNYLWNISGDILLKGTMAVESS